jgi:hypothetical protein
MHISSFSVSRQQWNEHGRPVQSQLFESFDDDADADGVLFFDDDMTATINNPISSASSSSSSASSFVEDVLSDLEADLGSSIASSLISRTFNSESSSNGNNNDQEQQQGKEQMSLEEEHAMHKGKKRITARVSETGSDSLKNYLKTMCNHELLNKNEEIILGREIQILIQWESHREELESQLLRYVL